MQRGGTIQHDGPDQVVRGSRHSDSHGPMLRRIAIGGALGALPGALVAVVPLLLHELGAITSDQSQIGFIGLPLFVIGTLIGIATAASDSGFVGTALLGAGAGFFVGLATGLLIIAGLRTVGAEVAGIWLFLTPFGMIGGAALACYLRLRRIDRHDVS